MPPEDPASTRVLLVAERVRIGARLEDLTRQFEGIVAASESTNADDEHDPEGSTIAFDRAQVAAVIAQTRRHLDDLDTALRRLQSGAYGVCERCGDVIGAARLDALPAAATCISCASTRRR